MAEYILHGIGPFGDTVDGFILPSVGPVFYSVSEENPPPTFNPLLLNAAQPTRVIQ